MKKNLKYIIGFLAGVLLFTTSCNDEEFFDLEFPPEFPWNNPTEFERAALGAYNAAFVANDWANIIGVDIAMDFTLSDCSRFIWESVHGFPSDEVNGRDFTKNNFRVESPWATVYKSIGVCNSALEVYYEADGNPFPEALESDRINNVDRIVGELHFMRAYDYFYLVRWFHPPYNPGGDNSFASVPFKTKFASGAAEAFEYTPGTTQEIYDSILEDLLIAKELVPERYDPATMNPAYKYGRANKFVVSAILMRVYVILNEWEKAKAEADYIINQGGYELDDDYMTLFARSRNNYTEPTKGLIWEFFAANQKNPPATYSPAVFSHFTKMNMFGSANDMHYGRHVIDENGDFVLTGDPTDPNTDTQGKFIFGGWNQYSLSHPVLINKLGWYTDDYQLTDKALRDKRIGHAHRNMNSMYYYIGPYAPKLTPDEEPLKWKRREHIATHLTNSYMIMEDRPTLWVDKFWRGESARKHNACIVRLAEIYQTRAAINMKLGNAGAAAEDINKIRERAFLPLNPDETFETHGNKADASTLTIEDVHNERIAELSGEGLWLWYACAFQLDIDKGDHRGLGTVLTPPYSNMYWPLPVAESRFYFGEDVE